MKACQIWQAFLFAYVELDTVWLMNQSLFPLH